MLTFPSRITWRGAFMYLTDPELRLGLAEGAHPPAGRRYVPTRFRRPDAAVRGAASARRSAAPCGRTARSGVERFVDEPVGELVVLAANRRVGHGTELARKTRRGKRQFAQGCVLHLVFAAHL